MALGTSSSDSIANATPDELCSWVDARKGRWLFGHLGYDFKNQLENLKSTNPDGVGFQDSFFFVPDLLLEFDSEGSILSGAWPQLLPETNERDKDRCNVSLIWRESRREYLDKINLVKHHIQRGDVYELNYCHEIYSQEVRIDPFELYTEVNAQTNTPFSAFVRNGECFAICGSPERFLRKEGLKVVSQPIKGTRKRSALAEEDERLRAELSEDQKERSENIMIVDLVRNDLSKLAQPGTVRVPELCEIYSFDTVHQMISTVEAELKSNVKPMEAVFAAFPMGSMTGAPKIRAMELIEELEETRRGLYSGCIGYINPEQDFDFNVVIRTLLYNGRSGYLSGMVGGAITSKSSPEREYEETLLKAEALINAIERCTK